MSPDTAQLCGFVGHAPDTTGRDMMKYVRVAIIPRRYCTRRGRGPKQQEGKARGTCLVNVPIM